MHLYALNTALLLPLKIFAAGVRSNDPCEIRGFITGGCICTLLRFLNGLWDSHLSHGSVVSLDIGSPKCSANCRLSVSMRNLGEGSAVPVLVNANKIEATGTSSSSVATVPKLVKSVWVFAGWRIIDQGMLSEYSQTKSAAKTRTKWRRILRKYRRHDDLHAWWRKPHGKTSHIYWAHGNGYWEGRRIRKKDTLTRCMGQYSPSTKLLA